MATRTHNVNVPDPLADPTYRYQAGSLKHQADQFNTGQAHALAQYKQTADQQISDLGWHNNSWDMHDTNAGTLGAASRDISNDFTTRGMGYSSPFITAMQNMKQDYVNRLGKINTGTSQYQGTQKDQLATYTSSNAAALAQERRNAIGRIATRLGIQPTQVTPGRATVISVPNP